jgi:hypothetical protein
MSSLTSAGKAAIQAANELLRPKLHFNLMQDGLWVFIWIVTSIMPSRLMYNNSLKLAEDQLQLDVPAASRTTQDYRKFLHEVARVSHHISDHTTLLGKILAVFTPNKDQNIQSHLGAYRHLLRNGLDTVDINQVINTLSMLLTSVDEAVIEDQVALSQHPSYRRYQLGHHGNARLSDHRGAATADPVPPTSGATGQLCSTLYS